MPTNPSVNFITSYSSIVHHEFQQMVSKLFPYVTLEKLKGAQQAIEGLGGVKARKIDGRFQPVVFNEIDHMRRKLSRNEYSIALPITDKDRLGMEIDQQTHYAKATVAGMQRTVDKVIYEAAFATVYTGANFETSVTYLNDGVQQVDATSGLTYEKLLEIKKNFVDRDVDVDMNEFCIAYTGDEDEALMKETELTSGDFSRQYVIDKGFLARALIFDLKTFAGDPGVDDPIIQLNSSGERRCLAFVKGGIALGINREMEVLFEKRTDLNGTWQLVSNMFIGAVRRQGNVVQEILTTPA